jgi:hypothetical protein
MKKLKPTNTHQYIFVTIITTTKIQDEKKIGTKEYKQKHPNINKLTKKSKEKRRHTQIVAITNCNEERHTLKQSRKIYHVIVLLNKHEDSIKHNREKK